MPTRLALALLLLSSAPSWAQQTPSLAQLRAGFKAPPPEARLRCYWWWLNGQTDKTTITHDLEEMKAKGFGGALLVDADGASQLRNRPVPPGPTFGSPAWMELYTHALAEADRLGLDITLNITSGWNLGGPNVTPEQSSKLLMWTRTPVAGGGAVSVQLAAPPSKNGFYRQVAVLAYPLHHGAEIRPVLHGLRLRSAASETGFSMPESAWMLNADAGPPTPKGTPGLGQGDDIVADEFAAATKLPDTTLAEVIDLTAKTDATGKLTWTVPAGAWEVLRIGYTNSDARVSTASGAWQGRAIDYLSRAAFDAYWDHTVEPLLVAAKPYRSLKMLASDSWELGGTNWTETFAAEFKQRRGYDPVPWLPVLAGRIIDTPDASARFLTDLRRTVADLINANHYDHFAERAAQYGLGIQAESGGPHGAPIDALGTFRHAAVPQTEFWSINGHRNKDIDRFFAKESASAANIYGQRFIADEGETSIGPHWSESLAKDLKPSFDMAITEGMNRLVWHEFTSSPAASGLPGQEYFAGTHLNPKVTWWNAGDAFFRYLNRVQFLMQQGTAVNDLLYFYGDNVPAFVRLKADDPAHVLPGYDYDVTNEDALLHTIRMGGGKLVGPSGVAWRALALPSNGRLSLAVLEAVQRYVSEGGTVIGLAPVSPSGLVTPAIATRFASLVQTLWGSDCAAGSSHPYGKGRVFCTSDAHAALMAMKLAPDVELAEGKLASDFTASLDYVHRRIGKQEVYFLRSGSAQPTQHEVLFRARAASVELWDAVTGSVQRATATSLPSGQTRVSLALPAFGSIAVVFSAEPTAHAEAIAAERRTLPLHATGAWKLSFQPERGAPAAAVSISAFKSWTESSDPGVRYFSGTATYTAQVDAPAFAAGERILLHLPDVREIARVRINGTDAGTIWALPLNLRVDSFLKPGRNTIEIEVTNLWPNRIIGDLQPSVPQTFTKTNITTYKQNSPLLPSGLIGEPEWILERPESILR